MSHSKRRKPPQTEHDEDDYGEGNALEDAMVEEADTFEEGGEEAFLGEDGFKEVDQEETSPFSEDEIDALEDSLTDALAAREGDEFFRALLGGVGQIAEATQRGATRVSQAARRAGEAVTAGAAHASVAAGRVGDAAREAAQTRNPLGHFLHLLRQHQRQGFDELDSLEELSDEFAEGDYDEAIPVLAGLAARSVLSAAAGRAVRRVSRPLRRRVLRSAVQTAQSLVRQGGAEGMRALPRIVRRVARRAARTGLRPSALPQAIQRTAAQVLAQRAPSPVGIASSIRDHGSAARARRARRFSAPLDSPRTRRDPDLWPLAVVLLI